MGSHTLRDVFVFDKIPSIPSVAYKVIGQSAKSDFDLLSISRIIRFDPGMTCSLVSRANSKTNGLREVASIHNAILTCGPKESIEVLNNRCVLEESPRLSPFVEMFEFGWSHCISQAIAAESLKELGFTDDASTMFLTGLLSDIGVLALMQTYPEEYNTKVWQALLEGKELHELDGIERDTFGFSHVTVGHELGRRWRLGESYSSAILQHHQHVNGGFYSMISQAASKMIEVLDVKVAENIRRDELNEHMEICFQQTPKQVDLLLDKVEDRRRRTLKELDLVSALSPLTLQVPAT